MNMVGGDPLSFLQSQLVAMTAMKPDSGVMAIVFAGLIALLLKPLAKVMEGISKYLELQLTRFSDKLTTKASETLTQVSGGVLPVERKPSSQIVMERTYENTSANSSAQQAATSSQGSVLPSVMPAPGQETADAIIELMSLAVSAQRVRLINLYYVEHGNPILLSEADDVHCRTSRFTKDGAILKHVEVEVWSYTKTLPQLKDWVTGVQQQYVIARTNKLGNDLYFFDTIPPVIPIQSQAGGKIVYNWDQAPKELTFQLTPFVTTKRMSNIFGEGAEVIRERVKFFLTDRAWYEKHGIPYTLGILIKGAPGTGKTSFSKAIAKESHRHIFNVTLRGATRSQLSQLFQNPRVSVANKVTGRSEQLIIPIDQRLYLFDDIDVMSDVVLQRTTPANELFSLGSLPKTSLTADEKEEHVANLANWERTQQANQALTAIVTRLAPDSKSSEEVDLAFLLNLFDGVAEASGRLMLWTSNYPEKLDSALVRPGRIDVNVEMGECSSKTINDMLRHFLDDYKDGETFTDRVLTPAQVQECIFRNSKSYVAAVVAIHKAIAAREPPPFIAPGDEPQAEAEELVPAAVLVEDAAEAAGTVIPLLSPPKSAPQSPERVDPRSASSIPPLPAGAEEVAERERNRQRLQDWAVQHAPERVSRDYEDERKAVGVPGSLDGDSSEIKVFRDKTGVFRDIVVEAVYPSGEVKHSSVVKKELEDEIAAVVAASSRRAPFSRIVEYPYAPPSDSAESQFADWLADPYTAATAAATQTPEFAQYMPGEVKVLGFHEAEGGSSPIYEELVEKNGAQDAGTLAQLGLRLRSTRLVDAVEGEEKSG